MVFNKKKKIVGRVFLRSLDFVNLKFQVVKLVYNMRTILLVSTSWQATLKKVGMTPSHVCHRYLLRPEKQNLDISCQIKAPFDVKECNRAPKEEKFINLTFSASVLILLILFPYDKSAW